MKVWQVNFDFQFVINVYVCIMYVVLYVSKLEKILGDVLKFVSKNLVLVGLKKMMEIVFMKFFFYCEVSV